MSIQDLVIVDSGAGAAATCVVCGNDIPAGEGVTARLGNRTLRFKCPGCVSRFAVDPDRYLSGGPSSCCDDEHADASHAGHASYRMVEARSLPVRSGRERPTHPRGRLWPTDAHDPVKLQAAVRVEPEHDP